MISVNHNMTNPYATYGLNHFLSKYGISAKINEDNESDIEITYNNSEKNKDGITLRIFSNDIYKEIIGYLEIDNETVPLFETPKKLNIGDKVIAIFRNESYTYPCIMVDNNTLIVGFDIFNEIGHILSGFCETIFNEQNDESKRLTKIPMVDILEKLLFDSLQSIRQKNGIDLEYKSFLPDGKKFAVCLTHDVDRVKKTFQYVTHTIRNLKNGEISLAFAQLSFLLRREDPYWNFDRIMEMERKLGVKSTFFFLNEERKFFCSPSEWKLYWGRYDIKDAEIVETMKRLDAGGWEIGVHGSYNSYRDLKMLEEEKKVLEEILGKKVHGISQHYCNLEIPETWEYHKKIGLAYDSSVGFVTDIGFRYGTCHPFHPFNPAEGRTLSVWEMPIIIMDNACAYKNWKDIMDIISSVEKYNGLLLLRWHQAVFNEHEFPGRSKIYERIIEICKERGARVTNACEVVEWLTQREKQVGNIADTTINRKGE